MKLTETVVQILELGLTGLVFLLMFMGYRLLKNEQDKENPHPDLLKRASLFVWQSIAVAALVGTMQLAQLFIGQQSSDTASADTCLEEITAFVQVSRHPEQTLDTLRAGIRNTWIVCGGQG